MPSLVTLIDQIFDILVFVAILDLLNDLVGMVIAIFNHLLNALGTIDKVFGSLLNCRSLFFDDLNDVLGGDILNLHAVKDRYRWRGCQGGEVSRGIKRYKN